MLLSSKRTNNTDIETDFTQLKSIHTRVVY